MQVSTAHFEHSLPLLAKLDLPELFGAYSRFKENEQDTAALSGLVKVVVSAAEARVLRKLSAVQRATSQQLVASESDPEVLSVLEVEAAGRPFMESVEDVMAFFFSLGLSVPTTPSSSGEGDLSSSETEKAGDLAASL